MSQVQMKRHIIKQIQIKVQLTYVTPFYSINICAFHFQKYGDRLWPWIIFGSLMFIPGSYHVYLAVNVFMGTPGYSFDDIPEFD